MIEIGDQFGFNAPVIPANSDVTQLPPLPCGPTERGKVPILKGPISKKMTKDEKIAKQNSIITDYQHWLTTHWPSVTYYGDVAESLIRSFAKGMKSAIAAANFYNSKAAAYQELAHEQQLVVVDLQQQLKQSKSLLTSLSETSQQQLAVKDTLIHELTAHSKCGRDALVKLTDINATQNKATIRTEASIRRIQEIEDIKNAKKAKTDKEQKRRLDVCRDNMSAHGSTGQFGLCHASYVSLFLGPFQLYICLIPQFDSSSVNRTISRVTSSMT